MSVEEFRRRAGEAILGGVDRALLERWEPAKQRAAEITGSTRDDQVKAVTAVFARELGAIGAATGAIAAVPSVGGAVVVTGSFAEFGYFTFRSSELVLTIGALHGHTDATIEEQRAWLLGVLAFGDGASKGFTKLAGELGKGLGKKTVEKIPMATLRAINAAAGRTIRPNTAPSVAWLLCRGPNRDRQRDWRRSQLLQHQATWPVRQQILHQLPYRTIEDTTEKSVTKKSDSDRAIHTNPRSRPHRCLSTSRNMDHQN